MPDSPSLTVLRDLPGIARLEANQRLPNWAFAPENDGLQAQVDAVSVEVLGFTEEQTQFRFSQAMRDYVRAIAYFGDNDEISDETVRCRYRDPAAFVASTESQDHEDEDDDEEEEQDEDDSAFLYGEPEWACSIEQADHLRKEWEEFEAWEAHFDRIDSIPDDARVKFFFDLGWDIAGADGDELVMFEYFERQTVMKIGGLPLSPRSTVPASESVEAWEARMAREALAFRGSRTKTEAAVKDYAGRRTKMKSS